MSCNDGGGNGGAVVSAGVSPVKTLLALGTERGHLLLNKFPLHMAANAFKQVPAHAEPIVKVGIGRGRGGMMDSTKGGRGEGESVLNDGQEGKRWTL